MRDIETQLAARDVAPVERERCVRMLVGLTRALRDLAALRKQSEAARAPAVAEYEDEDFLPADIDAIVRELSHKLEAMAAGAGDTGPSSPPDDTA